MPLPSVVRALIERADPAKLESGLTGIRFARNRWLDDTLDPKAAAHEMSCAIGDLLRAIGMDT